MKKNTYSLIIISLLLLGCVEDPSEGINIDDVLTLTFADDSIALANGKDRITIIAELGSESDPNQIIKFSTDAGTFAGTNGANELEIMTSGETTMVDLVSTTSVKDVVTILAKVGEFTATAKGKFIVDTTLVSINEIISIEIPDKLVQADGNDRISISSVLQNESAPNQEVTFTTDQGFFAGTDSQKTITAVTPGRRLEVFLISDLVVNPNVTVTASVNGFIVTEFVSFERAYPSDILLEVDKFSILAGQSDKIDLTAKIFLDGIADPSEETRINFSQNVVGNNNLQEIELPSFAFTENGVVTIPIASKNDSTGRIQIIASVPGTTNVTDQIEIEIIE